MSKLLASIGNKALRERITIHPDSELPNIRVNGHPAWEDAMKAKGVTAEVYAGRHIMVESKQFSKAMAIIDKSASEAAERQNITYEVFETQVNGKSLLSIGVSDKAANGARVFYPGINEFNALDKAGVKYMATIGTAEPQELAAKFVAENGGRVAAVAESAVTKTAEAISVEAPNTEILAQGAKSEGKKMLGFLGEHAGWKAAGIGALALAGGWALLEANKPPSEDISQQK